MFVALRSLLHVNDDNRSLFLVDPDYLITFDPDFCLLRFKRWRRQLGIHSLTRETVGPREINKIVGVGTGRLTKSIMGMF